MSRLNAHTASHGALGRTVAVCVLLLLLALWSAFRLTHGFQVWTEEDARRLEVALQPRSAPEIQVQGPGLADTELPALLASHGGATIVDFIYTQCQTVCLSLGTVFQQIQTELQAEGAAGVHLLSISFDGPHDDIQALAKYGRRFAADRAHWNLVRVPDAAQEQQLLRRLGVVVVPDGRGDFEHNAALLVFDGQAQLRRIFDMEERELALNYARHLARQPATLAGAAS